MDRDSVCYNVNNEQKGSSLESATLLIASLSLDRDRRRDEPESPTSLSEASNPADDNDDVCGDSGASSSSSSSVPAISTVSTATVAGVSRLAPVQIEVASIQCSGKSVKGRAYQNEDTHIVHHLHTSSGEARCLFGVFDGHGGTSASAFCQEHFLSFVTRQPEFHQPRERLCRPAATEMLSPGFIDSETLISGKSSSAGDIAQVVRAAAHTPLGGELPKATGSDIQVPRDTGIGLSLAKAFLECDEAFIRADRLRHAELRTTGGLGSPCPQGCAALVVVLDRDTLTVANAGDCRAVLWHVFVCFLSPE